MCSPQSIEYFERNFIESLNVIVDSSYLIIQCTRNTRARISVAQKMRKKSKNDIKKYISTSVDPQTGCMFVITMGSENIPVGTVGYWEKEWDGQTVWETGWSVLSEYQRQEIATVAAKLVIELVIKLRSHRYLFAYPSVDNHPSNAICRKLGFILMGDKDFEYPPGNILHCNIWRFDLLKISNT